MIKFWKLPTLVLWGLLATQELALAQSVYSHVYNTAEKCTSIQYSGVNQEYLSALKTATMGNDIAYNNFYQIVTYHNTPINSSRVSKFVSDVEWMLKNFYFKGNEKAWVMQNIFSGLSMKDMNGLCFILEDDYEIQKYIHNNTFFTKSEW